MSVAPLWMEENQRYLAAAVADVRTMLEHHIEVAGNSPNRNGRSQDAYRSFDRPYDEQNPPAIETMSRMFGLSPFERYVLLLCAAMELDASLPALCAVAQGDSSRSYPTFSLALAAFPGAHWSALGPDSPLRHWRLVETHSGTALTLSPLRIDERILHYLSGVQHLDERLHSLVDPLEHSLDLVPSHERMVHQIRGAWMRTTSEKLLPVMQLCGPETEGKRTIAAKVCAGLGLALHVMQADVIPTSARDRDQLVRIWTREAALNSAALLLDCEDVDVTDVTRVQATQALLERLGGPVLISCRDRWTMRRRRMVPFDVNKPTSEEQRLVWRGALEGAHVEAGQVEQLVAQFDLSMQAIQNISTEALGHGTNAGDGEFATTVWDTCRIQARPRLDDLAQRMELNAGWNDLVLPEAQLQSLREIVMHVRERTTVYETWGFRTKGNRGLGVSGLFAGASGTGKTMAAEVLAGELRLDLYRIDLSSVVSKYIGETEKNLRRVFDAAEEGGAVLLFDEADALFGKRSEVKDSHDRYANIEVGYLLQRMESYRGLALLTTNLKKSLDNAFLRRIRFVLQFPFPDATQRLEIWRRVFPQSTPCDGLDHEKLAQLSVAGGNIRNIALHAAFLAADAKEPVRMIHLLRAAQGEYAKLEKPLTGAETEGWL